MTKPAPGPCVVVAPTTAMLRGWKRNSSGCSAVLIASLSCLTCVCRSCRALALPDAGRPKGLQLRGHAAGRDRQRTESCRLVHDLHAQAAATLLDSSFRQPPALV